VKNSLYAAIESYFGITGKMTEKIYYNMNQALQENTPIE
jgi:hypothetical protein